MIVEVLREQAHRMLPHLKQKGAANERKLDGQKFRNNNNNNELMIISIINIYIFAASLILSLFLLYFHDLTIVYLKDLVQ